MAAKKKNTEPKLSEAFQELEDIVQEFEEGDVDLENSIEKFKKGLTLSKYLKRRLQEIENEIIEIKDEFDDVEDQMEIDDIEENTASTEDNENTKNDSDDSQGEIPF